jgi:hypothetical protein
MRLRCLVITLSLLVAFASDSSGQSKRQPPREDSKAAQQANTPDNRGTEQSPVIVKILPTEQKPETIESSGQEKWFYGWSLSDKIAVIASLIAFLQFLALIAIVHVVRRTGQRQVRAYIIAGATDIIMQGPEDAVSISVRITIRNTGQTPAHDVSIVAKTDLLEHPIKLPFDFALERGADSSRSVLGAGRDAESTSPAERPFNADEMTRARNREGSSRIYTWGSVSYRDVFGRKHYTHFCSSLLFEEVGKPIAHASEHHNDAS